MQDVLGVLAQMSRGAAIEEINAEFTAIMEAVKKNGGEGSVTIKIKVKGKSWNQDSGDLTEVDITHAVAGKPPLRKIGGSTFFVTREGVLTRNNPEQIEMFDGQTATRKEVV